MAEPGGTLTAAFRANKGKGGSKGKKNGVFKMLRKQPENHTSYGRQMKSAAQAGAVTMGGQLMRFFAEILIIEGNGHEGCAKRPE